MIHGQRNQQVISLRRTSIKVNASINISSNYSLQGCW